MKSVTQVQSSPVSAESFMSKRSAIAVGAVTGGIQYFASSCFARSMRPVRGTARTARTSPWNAASSNIVSFMLDAAASSTLSGYPLIDSRIGDTPLASCPIGSLIAAAIACAVAAVISPSGIG